MFYSRQSAHHILDYLIVGIAHRAVLLPQCECRLLVKACSRGREELGNLWVVCGSLRSLRSHGLGDFVMVIPLECHLLAH